MKSRTVLVWIGFAALVAGLTVAPASAATDSPGSAFSWGSDIYGELGDGPVHDQYVPVQIADPLAGKHVTAVAGGHWHACAIADGQAYCWGANHYSQLGVRNVWESDVPVVVTPTWGSDPVTVIAAGWQHSCAVAAGALYCWGSNADGQLGDSAGPQSDAPVLVNGPWGTAPVTAVSAGYGHTCAIAAGTLYCWGTNEYGQLGTGGTSVSTPTAVDTGAWGTARVTDVASGWWHTCAIADGDPYCWGSNDYGQLGNPAHPSGSALPVRVLGALTRGRQTATVISTSNFHSCAVVDNEVYCWGWNEYGQIGDGTRDGAPFAVPVAAGIGPGIVTDVATGFYHSCAVAGGRAFCWGFNGQGQIGDGGHGFIYVLTPTPVSTTGVLSGQTVFSISAAEEVTIATAAGPPSIPQRPTAQAGDAQVDLTWETPDSDGGTAVTGFTVTASPGGRTCETDAVTCVVTGLVNGTEYTFSIVAHNAAGDSPAATVTATPRTVPARPRNVQVEPGDQRLTLRWDPPDSDGGSEITGYVTTGAGGAVACDGLQTTCSVDGLTNGRPYVFFVVAHNAVGDSLAVEVSGIPAGKKVQEPRDAKGRAPEQIRQRGRTVVTGRGARTNAGQLIRTTVRCAKVGRMPAGGRCARVLRGPGNKVALRTFGTAVKIVIVQHAPSTADYTAFRLRRVYRLVP